MAKGEIQHYVKNAKKSAKKVSFCKVEFAKFTKISFFLITIMIYSQKYYIFAQNFKNAGTTTKSAAKLIINY